MLHPRPARLFPARHARAAALVIPSWWGSTPGMATIAAGLAEQGVSVALADLFDGRTATTEAEARALKALPRRVPAYRGLAADLAMLAAAAPGVPLGAVGFSMGAHWAVWLSQRPGHALARVVLFYGARGGSFAASRAGYQAHWAGADPWVSPAARRGMERALAAAGRPCESFDYPGTRHWFAEPGRPEHDPPAAATAMARTVAFLTAQTGTSAQ